MTSQKRSTPSRPARPPARLQARTLPGLEALLSEELVGALRAERIEATRGRVIFDCPTPKPPLAGILPCDGLGLLVRHAAGDFAGPRGLAELRGKLARTTFDRHLPRLPGLGLAPPEGFRVRVSVARSCGFAFFDVVREATPILERRLELPASEGTDALVVDIECSPSELHIGLGLPLTDWVESRRRTLPRSLVGALVCLARPAPRLTVGDPDCGSGELLQAWRSVAPSARVLGFSLGPRDAIIRGAVPAVIASPRAWPVAPGRLSRVISALPRITSPGQLAHVLDEASRCLAAGGRVALATALTGAWRAAIESQPRLSLERVLRVQQDDRPLDVIALIRHPDTGSHLTATTAGDRARAARKLGGATPQQKPRRARRGHRER
jgi:hypothetical protein